MKHIVIKYLVLLTAIIGYNMHCRSQSVPLKPNAVFFQEDPSVISLEDRSRRKFDNAVIADLDQDGFLDLLLTEHSRRVELYWNNGGVFKKGDPFIFGDTHGIAIDDYNLDGKMDVLVQPGGGDGKNPRKLRHFTVNTNREIKDLGDFTHFNGSRGRAVKFVNTTNNGTLDLITTAFPTLSDLDKGNVLYKQDDKLDFKFNTFLPHSDRMAMRAALIDFNSDGIDDIIFHGGTKLVCIQGEKDGSFKEVTDAVLGELSSLSLVNSISEIDFDNDGDMDLFLTRSKHPFASEAEYNPEENTFYFFARRTAFSYDNLNVEGDLILENLQMAYPDFDVFIGENKTIFERKSDKHGHQDLRLTQEQAKGFPSDTSKNGLYIGYLGNNLWKIAGLTNAPTSVVIHNVISEPPVIPLKNMPAKLLENNNGTFKDVTAQLQIDIKEQTTSAAVGDYNNDGYLDLFVVRYGQSASVIDQILYLNNRGKTFVKAIQHGIVRTELGATGMGADAFDYDKDGDLDIVYANERGKWHLFTNTSNSKNNHLSFKVGYAPSNNATAQGAILSVSACGNNYKRKVNMSSSPYSQGLNNLLHIGLGKCNKVSEAKVTWTNKESVSIPVSKLNTMYTAGNYKLK